MGSETFDLVIQPQKKDVPMVKSSSMRIYGPISNPKVKKVPFMEAARLIGEILMPYYFLPARALGYIWSLLQEDPHGLSPCLNMAP